PLGDVNAAAAVSAVVRRAVTSAAAGTGPVLIEALTYRVEAHTNADDASRYRTAGEVEGWLARDPVTRLRAHLRDRGLLDEAVIATIDAEAQAQAAALRQRMNTDTR